MRNQPTQRFSILTLALLSGLSAHAAPVPPDAGQTSRELQQQPALLVPKAVAPLRIEGEAATPSAASDSARVAVKAIRVRGNSVFASSELEALLAGLTGGEHSLAELDAGAARITAHYRARGYAFARAYLPAQDIVGGVVTISVLEGLIGQQRVANRSRLSDEMANAYLDGVKSGDVLRASKIDRALLLLNDTPGIGGARASLQPGASVGTADLVIELAPATPYSANVELDNYGNRYIGEYRLGATLALNSPLQIGDLLTLRALASDQHMTYARIAYAVPLGSSGLRAGFAYSDTRYQLGHEFAALQADGSATGSSLYATYPFIRCQSTNLTGTLTYESKKLIDQTGAPVSSADKRVRLVGFGLAGNHQDALLGAGATSFDASLVSGTLRMDAVSLTSDAASAQSNGAFSKLVYSISRLQRLSDKDHLSLALSGQQAGKNLGSSEKFSLGGATGVRAYPQGEGSGDEGMLVNLELRHSFTDTLQGVAFYDAGSVSINRNPFAAGANSRFISGAGLGVNANLAGVQVKAYLAWRGAGGAPQSEPATVKRSPRLWVQVGKAF